MLFVGFLWWSWNMAVSWGRQHRFQFTDGKWKWSTEAWRYMHVEISQIWVDNNSLSFWVFVVSCSILKAQFLFVIYPAETVYRFLILVSDSLQSTGKVSPSLQTSSLSVSVSQSVLFTLPLQTVSWVLSLLLITLSSELQPSHLFF